MAPDTAQIRKARRATILWRRAAVALVLCAAAAACGDREPQRPNLLLITVDTLRPDRLACYGGPPEAGAAICALGDSGARYLWALSPAPSTAPAIASILTARYPSYHGVTQFASTVLPNDARTLAEELLTAGYATAAFVCNPVLSRARNLQQGFEIYDEHMTRRESNSRALFERDAESATDEALAWAKVASEPWFLWVHYQDPHGPYQPPGAVAVRDRRGAPRLRVLDDHSGRGGIPAYQALPGVFSAEAYQRRYLEEILYLDRHLARLLSGLDALGAHPGVLLTADHGEAFGEDDYWLAHGHSVGLEQIRVPLLWRPPQSGKSRELRTPVSTIDVAPTLLAAAGAAVPKEFQGKVLPGTDPPAGPPHSPRPLFAEHRLRAAVLAGGVYYARDRWPFDRPVEDGISGGLLHPLAPRATPFGGDGVPPARRVEPSRGAGDTLEPLLAEFLAAAGEGAEPQTSEVPPSIREQLRALGYLE
jgi:arylsulfatase